MIQKDKFAVISNSCKSGFRRETVIELEQIAVLPQMQGQKIGSLLITESLEQVRIFPSEMEFSIKAVMVTTRADNRAITL